MLTNKGQSKTISKNSYYPKNTEFIQETRKCTCSSVDNVYQLLWIIFSSINIVFNNNIVAEISILISIISPSTIYYTISSNEKDVNTLMDKIRKNPKTY